MKADHTPTAHRSMVERWKAREPERMARMLEKREKEEKRKWMNEKRKG